MFRHSSRSRPLKDSTKPVAPRLAGRNERQPDPFAGPVSLWAARLSLNLDQPAGVTSEPLCLIHAPNESVDPAEIADMSLVEALFLQRYALVDPRLTR